MPRMNGLKAIEAIRRKKAMATTPIIALSARTDRIYQSLVRQAGANEVMTKPADLKKLVLIITSYLG
jgi:DNA-binding response OmpR family regulator